MLDITQIASYLKTSSSSGSERILAKQFCEELSYICQTETDALGNAICSVTGKDAPVVMLEAHSDEVGMQVTGIDEKGFVHIRRNGAIDNLTLLGQRVVISDERGDVEGVIGKKPIHISGAEQDKPVSVEDMWIDICAENKEDALSKVAIGDYVTIAPNYRIEGNKVISKGLDDKIGVFVIAEAMQRLAKEDLNINLYACAAAQEEVGCRGCKVAAERIKPDYAICVDVGFASDFPGMDELKYGKMELGKGVVINYNCDNNPELVKMAKQLAEEKNIPHQLYTFPSATGGSDAAFVQLAGTGIKTILLSIPCRYMHTPVEICDLRDVESCIRLAVGLCEEINKK